MKNVTTDVEIKEAIDVIMSHFIKYGPKNPKVVISTKQFSPSEIRAYEQAHRKRWKKEIDNIIARHGPVQGLMDFVQILLNARHCADPVIAGVYVILKFNSLAIKLARELVNPFDLYQRRCDAFAFWVNVVLALDGITRRQGVEKIKEYLKEEVAAD